MKNKENKNIKEYKYSTETVLLTFFHFIITVYAVFLAHRCNNGFNFGSFIIALCCPYMYIFYSASFNGLCMVTGNRE